MYVHVYVPWRILFIEALGGRSDVQYGPILKGAEGHNGFRYCGMCILRY